jgi:hypothetical protein
MSVVSTSLDPLHTVPAVCLRHLNSFLWLKEAEDAFDKLGLTHFWQVVECTDRDLQTAGCTPATIMNVRAILRRHDFDFSHTFTTSERHALEGLLTD